MTPFVLRQIEARAQQALDQETCDRYIPLVRRTAIRLGRKLPGGTSVSDLVSCGLLGLLEACAQATPDMSPEQFEAHVTWRVQASMNDHLRGLDAAIARAQSASNHLTDAIRDLSRALGRSPSEREIAERLRMTVDEYRSLLIELADAGVARLGLMNFDRVDETAPADGRQGAWRRGVFNLLCDAIDDLPPRMHQILLLHHQENLPLEEIATLVSMPYARVVELYTEAVHRLRAAIKR
jgi:RNA polymerase sigma factor for flagellar operon FliA